MKVGYLNRSFTLVCLLAVACLTQQRAFAASLPDFTDLVEKVSPSIVNISTVSGSENQQSAGLGPNEIPDELFKHFFGERFREYLEKGPQQNPYPKSLGSGFIISKDGYILTNNHVVEGADEILVRLSDRSELQATLVGSDPRSDLALLKVDATDLPAVKMGDSDDLKPGQWVLAIGSPFGFDYSVTAGIVSATGRSLANENYVPFIQTDVAINPGNSGGPLFNLDGEVVGINSQIYTRSGGFMGLSFSIPVSMAMEVVDQLKDTGHVARGWLGVYIQEVSKSLAESFGLDRPQGALITKVTKDSPAEAAGLLEGDVIIGLNDRDVEFSAQLPKMVGRVTPGTEVQLTVVRDQKVINMPLIVGELPTDEAIAQLNQRPQVPLENPLNIEVVELDTERRVEWSIEQGVVVSKIADGPGAEAGLMLGDVITSLNREPVDSISKFIEVARSLPTGKHVHMRVVRRGASQFLPLIIKP